MAPPKLKDHKQMLQAEEEEIDRLSSAIRKLDLRILHEKQGLARMKTRTRRTIKKYEARAALKTEQLAALTARMNHHRSSSVPEPDSLEDKDDLLVKCTWDTRDPRKLVIWQLERHIHWATRTPAWDSREALHEMLDLRTAAELRAGKPPGRGNLRLQRQFCRVDPGEKFDWGKPAEALRAFAEDVFRDAGEWMLGHRARELLIALEDWYFQISAVEREQLPGNVNDWNDLPMDVAEKWNATILGGNLRGA